ncbi:MAG: hypothetical protein HDR03_11985 [Lachnospiraceae bacterium]|nr:hypothetical protein [Lachnospiraceae bacterium]
MKEKKENRKEKITGGDYLALGLYAFAGLGMEVLYAYLLEPVLYGAPMQDWSDTQIIIHWILTCITWGIFAFILIRKSGEKYRFQLLEKGKPMRLWQYGLCVLFILIAFVTDYIVWDGFKVYLEYVNKGLLLFIFQYIYYAFETMLFLLIIVFGQKACEVWFHKEKIPYGGIICGLTWGLAHIFTKNLLTGLLGIALGFAMGSVYLLVNRDLKKAYVVLFSMFVI